jgi:hypothetical protein
MVVNMVRGPTLAALNARLSTWLVVEEAKEDEIAQQQYDYVEMMSVD